MALAVDRWGEGEEGHQAGLWKLCPICRGIPLPRRSCACAIGAHATVAPLLMIAGSHF